jgi:Ca-activated chloride channel homolog
MFTKWNIKIWEYEFMAPHFLWLLIIVPLIYYIQLKMDKKSTGDIKCARLESDQLNLRSNWIENWRIISKVIYYGIACLFIIALAKPYHYLQADDGIDDEKNGIDIVFAMDVSLSMYSKDFEPNRLEVSKRLAKEFVNSRKGDRIGMVVYAGEAYTACPSTLDYKILNEQIDRINGEELEMGTAIGIGLGTAVTRLRNDSIASKVIILLTDGSNNRGDLSPEMAAELAASKNIRVYTIGVGTNGMAPSPIITPFGIRYENVPVEIDEETLMFIAQKTGGMYFRATDEATLKQIYGEIDRLEKRRMVEKEFNHIPPATPLAFLNWAFVLLVLTWGLNKYFFRVNE